MNMNINYFSLSVNFVTFININNSVINCDIDFPIKDSHVCWIQQQNHLNNKCESTVCGKAVGLFSHRCDCVITLSLCRRISSVYEARLQRTLIPAVVTDSGTAKQPPNSSAHYTMQAFAWRSLLLNTVMQDVCGVGAHEPPCFCGSSWKYQCTLSLWDHSTDGKLVLGSAKEWGDKQVTHTFNMTPCGGSCLLNHDIQPWLSCKLCCSTAFHSVFTVWSWEIFSLWL